MSAEQKRYQDMQLQLQRESLEQAKSSVVEPVKSVDGSMKGATESMARAAQLRRGIASTFNRPTAFMAKGGNTSGSAAKLGE